MRLISYFLSISLMLWTTFSFWSAYAASKRGMATDTDFRLGPVIHGGLALYDVNLPDRQYYALGIRGENPLLGYSRIYARVIGLFENLTIPKVEGGTRNARDVRFHHRFVTLGFESPIYFEETRELGLEFGWIAGFTIAQVQFKEPVKPVSDQENAGIAEFFGDIFSDFTEIPPASLARTQTNPNQSQTQFMGGEFGTYFRYYGLYPLVPYASARISLGNMLDLPALLEGVDKNIPTPISRATPTPNPTVSATPVPKERTFRPAFKTGPGLNVGLDYYLFSRGVLGVEYTMWNWDFDRESDYTHWLVVKAGFLF